MSVDMIEALRAHLEAVIGVPCCAQMPSPRPDRFLYLERVGGVRSLAVDHPRITVEAWAETKKGAYDLVQQVRDLIVIRLPPVIGGIRVIRHREDAGPSYEPTTMSGAYRYRVTVSIRHQLIIEEKP